MPATLFFFAPLKPTLGRCFTALCLSIALPGISSAQPLTADDVVALALENAENRVFIQAPAEAAQGALTELETWRNPVLSVSREGQSGLGGDGSETSVSIERDFDFSGRRGMQADSARARLLAAQTQGAVTAAELRAEALSAYYAVIAAQAELDAIERFGAQLSQLETATRQRVTAGDASQLELERVRQETLLAPSLLANARLNAAAARDQLFIITGAERVLSDSLAGSLLPEAADLTAAPASGSARLAVLQAQADAAQSLEEAASRLAPDVTLGVGVRHTEGMGGETGVLMSASVPLPLFNRNQGDRQSRAADARLAEARLRREQRRLDAEATLLRRRAAALDETARAYDAEALSSAQSLQRIALISYRAGEIGALEAIDATRSAYEAELRAISLKHQARTAQIALHALLAETE